MTRRRRGSSDDVGEQYSGGDARNLISGNSRGRSQNRVWLRGGGASGDSNVSAHRQSQRGGASSVNVSATIQRGGRGRRARGGRVGGGTARGAHLQNTHQTQTPRPQLLQQDDLVEDDEERRRAARAARFSTPKGDLEEEQEEPPMSLPSTRFRFRAEMFLADLLAELTCGKSTDTKPIPVPKNHPGRHTAADFFFIDPPHLQRLQDYENAAKGLPSTRPRSSLRIMLPSASMFTSAFTPMDVEPTRNKEDLQSPTNVLSPVSATFTPMDVDDPSSPVVSHAPLLWSSLGKQMLALGGAPLIASPGIASTNVMTGGSTSSLTASLPSANPGTIAVSAASPNSTAPKPPVSRRDSVLITASVSKPPIVLEEGSTEEEAHITSGEVEETADKEKETASEKDEETTETAETKEKSTEWHYIPFHMRTDVKHFYVPWYHKPCPRLNCPNCSNRMPYWVHKMLIEGPSKFNF